MPSKQAFVSLLPDEISPSAASHVDFHPSSSSSFSFFYLPASVLVAIDASSPVIVHLSKAPRA